MGCLKGKNKTKKDKATHRCDKCGAYSDKAKDLCKAHIIKKKKKKDQK